MLPTLQRIASKENVIEVDAITGAEDFLSFNKKFLGYISFLEEKH